MKWWYPVFSAAGVILIVGTSEAVFGPNQLTAALMVSVACTFYIGILIAKEVDKK